MSQRPSEQVCSESLCSTCRPFPVQVETWQHPAVTPINSEMFSSVRRGASAFSHTPPRCQGENSRPPLFSLLVCGGRPSVEFDGQVLSVLAEELAVVVIDRPPRRQVVRAHGGEKVLPPATLQVHEALQALLRVGLDHLQAMRDIGLIEDPSDERNRMKPTDQPGNVSNLPI